MELQLGIIGYGVHGRHLAALAADCYPEATVTAFDDLAVQQAIPYAVPFAQWRDSRFAGHRFVVALGYHHPQLRVEIVRSLKAAGRDIRPLLHPSAQVSRRARVGTGVVIAMGVTVSPHVVLEDGVYLSAGTVVSHDVQVGAGCYVGPGVVLCGGSQIGPYTFLGANTTVADGRRVGSECRIGLATAVSRDVPDGVSVIGSPMRILNKPLAL